MAENGAVRITRRDAADLVLLRAGDLEAQMEGVALASKIMLADRAHHGDSHNALLATFSWTALLTPEDRTQFVADMDRLVWSAAELGTYRALLNSFRSWRGTAEAIADGMDPNEPLDWLEPEERVEVLRP